MPGGDAAAGGAEEEGGGAQPGAGGQAQGPPHDRSGLPFCLFLHPSFRYSVSPLTRMRNFRFAI